MTVLVIGQSGQIARALGRMQARSILDYSFVGHDKVDLCRRETLEAAIDYAKPRMVINAAAYTAVDEAEVETAIAYAVNADGPAYLAVICRHVGIPLIQLSTDYVFSGTKDTPYTPTDLVNPINVYGASKAAGERAVREALQEHVILRLAWVYSDAGRNFVTTMLRLADSHLELRVVADQKSTPTYAFDAASAIDRIAASLLSSRVGWGTYHLTNLGEASWYAFAEAIFAMAGRFGRRAPKLIPISTKEYGAPAPRPAYSVLDTALTSQQFSISMPRWQEGLDRCIASLCAHNQTTN
jgi:dTDP-4-dehydrorhamnose reductase